MLFQLSYVPRGCRVRRRPPPTSGGHHIVCPGFYDPSIASCHYELTRRSRAPRERVWALVADGRTWKDWAGVRQSSLEVEGEGDPNGVGSIRKLGYPPLAGSREQVVVHEPPHHLGYVILSGTLPVKNYRSDVFLEDAPEGGTLITWKGSFDPLIPGTASVMQRVVAGTIGRFARQAAARAEHT